MGFGNGGIAVIDPFVCKKIGSIQLPAHPEAFTLEETGHRIFVNVPNSREVAVIDREQGRIIASWRTDLAFANYPIALDETSHRLFVGCRMPPRLIVINTDTGEVVAKVALSGDVDDLFYDNRRHRVYATCGAGKIDIIEQSNPDSYKTLATVDTAAGARTGLWVPELDTLFVAVPHRGTQRAEIRFYHPE